jgi:hypothetical protein
MNVTLIHIQWRRQDLRRPLVAEGRGSGPPTVKTNQITLLRVLSGLIPLLIVNDTIITGLSERTCEPKRYITWLSEHHVNIGPLLETPKCTSSAEAVFWNMMLCSVEYGYRLWNNFFDFIFRAQELRDFQDGEKKLQALQSFGIFTFKFLTSLK